MLVRFVLMFVCPVCPFVSRLPPVSFYRYVPTDRYTGYRYR